MAFNYVDVLERSYYFYFILGRHVCLLILYIFKYVYKFYLCFFVHLFAYVYLFFFSVWSESQCDSAMEVFPPDDPQSNEVVSRPQVSQIEHIKSWDDSFTNLESKFCVKLPVNWIVLFMIHNNKGIY